MSSAWEVTLLGPSVLETPPEGGEHPTHTWLGKELERTDWGLLAGLWCGTVGDEHSYIQGDPPRGTHAAS